MFWDLPDSVGKDPARTTCQRHIENCKMNTNIGAARLPRGRDDVHQGPDQRHKLVAGYPASVVLMFPQTIRPFLVAHTSLSRIETRSLLLQLLGLKIAKTHQGS